MNQELFQHNDLSAVGPTGLSTPEVSMEARPVPVGPPKHFETFDQRAVIKVCGIGGGGGNAVDRMIADNLTGVEYIVINTDAQALRKSKAAYAIQIGKHTCGGLGAGADPETGRKACEEDIEQVRAALEGTHLVMLAVGLGGGTGTGAAPLVAKTAREIGALTIAFVTLPFPFEGRQRMDNALQGLDLLKEHVDTMVVVLNERILEISTRETSFLDAFRRGDDILYDGVRAVTELITVPGLINVDFADLQAIIREGGRALMGIGTGEKEDRAVAAARMAIECPLLDQSDIVGAQGVIINVRGGSDMRMREAQDAIDYIRQNTSANARIIFGAIVEDQPREDFQVTVIAAGFPERNYREYYTRQFAVKENPAASRVGPEPEATAKQKELTAIAASSADIPRQTPAAASRETVQQPLIPELPGTGSVPAPGQQKTPAPQPVAAAQPEPAMQPKTPSGPVRRSAAPAAKASRSPEQSAPRQQMLDDQPIIFTDAYNSRQQQEDPEEKKQIFRIPAYLRRFSRK